MLLPLRLSLLVAVLLVGDLPSQRAPATDGKLRGYAVMAGGLGRVPAGPTDMWSNTVDAHLAFIEKAKVDLVVIEVPYGIDARHPRSPLVVSFMRKLQTQRIKVWILYPHVLAEAFDLPRQVDADGKEVSWNCCFNHPDVQSWLVDNGRRLVEAYEPDGLLLFGTFHKGGACHCARCKESRDARSGRSMEEFFARWSEACRKVAPRLRLGTTDFWGKPSRRTLECLDFVSPVVPIFRPDHAKPGQMKGKASGWRSSYRGKEIVPYVKLFLASQTHSATEDVLAAVREGAEQCDGFFLWGYNPGHSYARQDYDHDRLAEALAELAPRRR